MGIGIFEIIILSGIGLVLCLFLGWAFSLIWKSVRSNNEDRDS